LLFTGRTATAQEMHELGVVGEVVARAELEQELQRLAERLAALSATSLARMKRVVGEGLDLPIDQAVELEHEVAMEHMASADVAEGLAAFSEGRPPRFEET